MNLKGTAMQAFAGGFTESAGLARRYYPALLIPVSLGFIWGIVSRKYLAGNLTALVSSVMMRKPGIGYLSDIRRLEIALILTMAVSVLLWIVALAGAGLILRRRNGDTALTVDEVLSYTGNRLGALLTGGLMFVFIPAIPVTIPAIGFLYLIGFIIYIFFIGKNYGGFFFWAYPVAVEEKSAAQGFAIAKGIAPSKKRPFWVALVLGFLAVWIVNMFLAFVPYVGFILIWTLNLVLLIYAGILYYDYAGDAEQQASPPPPQA